MKYKADFFYLFIIILIAASLRLLFLDRFPPSLYSDEVSQGYNAYSILKTGKDEFGTLLPVSIRSFGDWKPPLSTYLMIPFIKIFGLNVWGIRLPSAILGTLTVLLTYYLIAEIITILSDIDRDEWLLKKKKFISLLTALFLAVSPWHILQSRASMLTGVELFFFCLAIWSFLRGLSQKNWWYLSSVSWILAIYSYYAMRLIVPLFLGLLIILFHKKIKKKKKAAFFAAILGLILLFPLFIVFLSNNNVLFGRAKTVSIFYDKGVALTVWDLIAQDGINMPSKLAQFYHNKPYHYVIDIVRRFFQHFDGKFLFIIGDQQPPFQIPNMGILYLIDGVFIITGLIYLIRRKSSLIVFLAIWITLSILPAALTFMTPAANRTFTMIIPLMFLNSIGVAVLISKNRGILKIIVVILLYFISFSYFGNNYFVKLPKNNANWWHYGYKELYEYLKTQEDNYSNIYISAKTGVPYIFLLFNRQINPNIINSKIHRNLTLDEFGFEHVDSFDKYRFPRYFSWEKDGEHLSSNTLLVLTAEEISGPSAKEIHQIKYPNGGIAFRIYQIEK